MFKKPAYTSEHIRKMNTVITIGREFGSGGRELGRRLAEELGFDYYDKEIITEIVNHTELSEAYINEVIEKRPHHLYPIKIGATISIDNDYAIKQMQNIYGAQTDVIKNMADKSNCVIVGRCADYILSDYDVDLFRIFVYADIESRIKRCIDRAPEGENISEKEMKKQILKIDRARASYYSSYTLQNWSAKENYDLCINTTNITIKELAPHLANMFK